MNLRPFLFPVRKMNISIAYISIICIWATTPLAIKWSSEGSTFLFGVTSRMVIGLVVVLCIHWFMQLRLPMHKQAKQTYFISGISIYGAMLCVYWGSQYISSGWISIIFGLTPLITAIISSVILDENSFTTNKIIGQCLGISGLVIMFITAFDKGMNPMLGIAAVLLSAFIHSASAVAIKNINAGLHGLTATAGGLIIAVPAYLLTWLLFDRHFPEQITTKGLISIIYLGVIATAFGFSIYYYALKHLSATTVATIAFVSPVLALTLGNVLNHETIGIRTIIGGGLILLAMLFHEIIGSKNNETTPT